MPGLPLSLLAAGIIVLALEGCSRQAESPPPAPSHRPSAQSVALATNLPEAESHYLLPAPAHLSQLPVYDLRLNPGDLESLETRPFSNDKVPATWVFDNKAYEGVEVRLRGAWSRGWPKKSLKVFFKDTQPFEGIHTLNLNSGWRDPAFIREPLAYYVYGACGSLALKSRMARLQVNNQFRGLYVEVEQPEKAFLRRIQMKGASIYKANSPNNQADERDLGAVGSFAEHYSIENHKKTKDHRDLQRFCHELARSANAREFFDRNMDLEVYVNYLAATVLTQNWDSYNKNHFLIYDGEGSKKWYVLPWDLDRTFGDLWNWSFQETRLPITLGTRQAPGITGWNRLEDRFFSDPELRTRFLDRLSELL